MNKNRDILVLLGLPFVLLASGCVHGRPKPQTESTQEVRLEGEITQQEFGCVQVKTDDGQRYSLARDLEGSKPGQRVWVVGYMVKTKGCMPGLSVMPKKAGLVETAVAVKPPAPSGGAH